MKVSVITPSVRIQGLKVNQEALKNQSLKDLEWLICSKEDPEIKEATWIKDTFSGGYWSLNRAYNELFRHSCGEVVITMQDWLWAPPDALQRFVDAIKETDGGIISGVGDQYEKIGKWGKPEVKIWSDPRRTDKYGDFYESLPSDNEWNFAAFTKDAVFDVGGCCEKLDWTGYGMDGYQVNERWDALGYKFYLDQTNISYTVRHNRDSHGGEENWNKNNNLTNGQYEKVRQEFIKKGEWPRMRYLDS